MLKWSPINNLTTSEVDGCALALVGVLCPSIREKVRLAQNSAGTNGSTMVRSSILASFLNPDSRVSQVGLFFFLSFFLARKGKPESRDIDEIDSVSVQDQERDFALMTLLPDLSKALRHLGTLLVYNKYNL